MSIATLIRMGPWLAILALLFVNTVTDRSRDKWRGQAQGLSAKIEQMDRDAHAADAKGKTIAGEIRSRTDEETRAIGARADDQRVRGPGKATCPAVPARPGGQNPVGGKPDAAGPQLPPDDRAAVPWPWLVERSKQADLNRAEVLAWREWYDRMVREWPK
jgi:hypothetical protein